MKILQNIHFQSLRSWTIITFLGLFVILFESHAQVLQSSHTPRPGDVIELSQMNMTSAGEGGRKAVWDYSQIKLAEKGTGAKFYLCPGKGRLLVREYLETLTYYFLANDTLKNCGYENNQQNTLWDYCENAVVYPMTYGDSIKGCMYGRGSYCMRYPLRAYGIYKTMVDGTGEMTGHGDRFR